MDLVNNIQKYIIPYNLNGGGAKYLEIGALKEIGKLAYKFGNGKGLHLLLKMILE